VQTVADQRVSHAQLFYGPENPAKLALAIAYAQYINCCNHQPLSTGYQPLTTDSCGTCPSCVKYQKLVHPDLHFVYPVSTTKKIKSKPQSKYFIEEWRKFMLGRNFGGSLLDWYEFIGIENKQGIINVDDCDNIISTLSYKSYESEYKVMIIWMVERLGYASAPMLLKILEEPPEKTLFLLISDDTSQIIGTIQSRCLMVRVPPAESGQLLNEETRENLHLENFIKWMRLCFSANVPALISFSSELAKGGREKQKSFLLYCLHMLELCPASIYGIESRLQQDPEEAKFLQKFAPEIMKAGLPAFHALFSPAVYHVERNAYGPLLFLDLSLKITRLFKPNFVPL
jgi:DNA polymerase-3 subunit delta'